MAFDFPNSPTVGQYVTGSGGIVYVWDGVKWTAAPMASPTAPPASTLPIVDGVAAVGTSLAYARADHVHPAIPDVGRNLIHNSLFAVAQRSAGPFTVNGVYTLDRWMLTLTNDTASISQGTFADAGRAAIGDEAAVSNLANTFTGNAAAGAFNFVTQWIEGVRRLGGKTVTVSFWAAAASGTPKLGVSLDQWFGTPGGGGSPQVSGAGQSVTLSTTWTRYSLTFTLASTAVKTLSTSLSDGTGLNFWYSSGATNNTRAGGIGVQSGPFSVYIWGVQLEIGSVATPLEKPDPQQDLAKCQRFYQGNGFVQFAGYGLAGQGVQQSWALPVQMRNGPALLYGFAGSTNVGSGVVIVGNAGFLYVQGVVAATGSWVLSGTYTASADL